MPIVDWQEPEEDRPKRSDNFLGGLPDPGIYLMKVESVTDGFSKSSGEQMFTLILSFEEFSYKPIKDWIMFGGKGRFIGRKKLFGLGLEGKENIEPKDLERRGAWVALVHKKSADGLFTNVNVDLAKGSSGGYWPSIDEPEGAIRPDGNPIAPIDTDITPF